MNFASGYADGLETVTFAPDGGIIVGGFVGAETPAKDMTFKSGGQMEDGMPFIGKISAADANGDVAPVAYEWFFHETNKEVYKGSTKSLRVDKDGSIWGICGKASSLIKLDQSGNVLFKTGMVDKDF